ncbi:MAG: BBP7 family outer membrane beta-barrel protein, partial [Pirellula sp.]
MRSGLRFGCVAAVGLLMSSSVSAQLRTGRETDREFYQPEPTAVSASSQAPSREKTKARKSPAEGKLQADQAVVQASSVSAKNVASSKNSRVEQAGCKNCQAGVPHSHQAIPVAESDETNLVYESVEDTGEFDMDFSEPQRMRRTRRSTTSACDPCGDPCGLDGVAYPLGFLGQLLRRSHFKIEAATFWPEGQNLPALVTTNRNRPFSTTVDPGAEDDPTRNVLFGGENVLQDGVQGIRGEFGTFFGPNSDSGVLLRFFDVGNNALSYNSVPGTEPLVVRPFTLQPGDIPSTIVVNAPLSPPTFPNSIQGNLDATISSELYGGDILFRHIVGRDGLGRLEFLAGYQTTRLAEDLRIASRSVNGTTTFELEDHFQTTSRFNGMALGLSGAIQDRRWNLSGMVKLGLGNMETFVGIDGFQRTTVVDVAESNNGLLARATNRGSYTNDTFVISPEVNVSLGYRITRRLDATFGYTYLGLPKVARVADQLDPDLSANTSVPLVGDARPSFELRESNFSLHSLSYGLQYRF